MKEYRTKEKVSLLGLGILILCMLCTPAYAVTDPNYNYDGFPLETSTSGTVNGDVYVSAGDNYGLSGTSYATNTLSTDFTNVPASGVVWAKLKVGVWGGSPARVGYVNTTLNDDADTYVLGGGTEYLDIINLPDNVYCCGSGSYLIQYDCTAEVQNLANSDITATITAWPETGLGTSRRLDSRIYGAVLIVVYEDGSKYTQYWINQGDLNLHKNGTVTIDNTSCSFEDLNSDITWFNGTVNETLTEPTLTVGYFAGDINQNDYLYFNVPSGLDSPYDLNNPDWDLNEQNYSTCLLGEDVADSMLGSATNFDLKTFNVGEDILEPNNNYAIFWRGHSDSGEIYDPSWPGVNPETEGYYSPFLAVLKITS